MFEWHLKMWSTNYQISLTWFKNTNKTFPDWSWQQLQMIQWQLNVIHILTKHQSYDWKITSLLMNEYDGLTTFVVLTVKTVETGKIARNHYIITSESSYEIRFLRCHWFYLKEYSDIVRPVPIG